MSADRILLEGLSFYGYHGALPAEQTLGQPFIVDCALTLDLAPAGAADDLKLTVDYGAVFRDIRAFVEGPPVQLLETLATLIAGNLLARYPIREVWVRVSKPRAPLSGAVFSRVAVEVTRRRATPAESGTEPVP